MQHAKQWREVPELLQPITVICLASIRKVRVHAQGQLDVVIPKKSRFVSGTYVEVATVDLYVFKAPS